MNLTELQREAHAIAKEKGWWSQERTFGDCIALVHSELSEALKAYREHGVESWIVAWAAHVSGDGVITTGDGMEVTDKPVRLGDVPTSKLCGVASELADVVIRVADIAEWYGVDLVSLVDTEGHHADSLPVANQSFADWVATLHMVLGIVSWHDRYEQGSPDQAWGWHIGQVVYIVQRMAAHYGIDLDAAIAAKMEYNRTCPYRHGGTAL